MSSSKSLPRNITLSTAFLAPIDGMVEDIFIGIFHDYCQRFGVKPTKKKMHVAICGIEQGTTTDERQLGVTISTDDRILVQVMDPSLQDGDESIEHSYVAIKFVEVLCHELVHTMQNITGRNPTYGRQLMIDRESKAEQYFFDPAEVEARLLESFYASIFGIELQTAEFDESE